MRRLTFVIVLAACATVGPLPAPPAATPPATPPLEATPFPPVATPELEVKRTPCPLTPTFRGTPGCKLVPFALKAPGLERAERFNCQLATTPEFVPSTRTPVIRWLATFIENNPGGGVHLLQEFPGSVHVVPDTLQKPFLLNGALAGITVGHLDAAFWSAGTCESVDGGPLYEVAPLEDGTVVALQQLVERESRVLLRAPDGTWRKAGDVPHEMQASLRGAAGRVAVLATRAQPGEWSVLLPDQQRTVVLRRLEAYSMGPLAAVPLPAQAPSRFSSAITLQQTPSGEWWLRRPGQSRLVLTGVKSRGDCRPPEYGQKPESNGFLIVRRPAFAAGPAGEVWLSWVEEQMRCDFQWVEKQPVRCLPMQPCHDTPPAHWAARQTLLSREAVLARLNEGVEEALRLKLPVERQGFSFDGALAITDGKVLLQTSGLLLTFDRRALENR